MMSEGLGEAFRIAREEAGISQLDLALDAKVSEGSIRNLEKNRLRRKSVLFKILKALNELRLKKGFPRLSLAVNGKGPIQAESRSWLKFPERAWLKKYHGPGALLTAEFRVVPFHGSKSEHELNRLVAWCEAPDKFGIRIYKGEGGAGKTRLAVELCHRLADSSASKWTTGFLQLEDFHESLPPWDSLPDRTRPILVVVDYAGAMEKTQPLLHLFRHLADCPAPKLRLLFLERDDLWLGRLHTDRAAREILLGPLLSRLNEDEVHALAPVAESDFERHQSFKKAARAFGKELGLKSALALDTGLSGALFDRVLFIHAQALLALFNDQGRNRESILRHLCAREEEYWEKRMDALGLSRVLKPVIKAAVAAINLNDGARDRSQAAAILGKVEMLRDQQTAVIHQIMALLRECYPQGNSGIAPLQPDELKSYFLSRLA